MKIIVDNKIPYIRPALACLGAEVVYIKGSSISAADVRDADALIVRTRTAATHAFWKATACVSLPRPPSASTISTLRISQRPA